MKKNTTLLYLALLHGILIGACTPCDDGDPADSNLVELNRTHIDSSSVD